jgi:hypothetical protein
MLPATALRKTEDGYIIIAALLILALLTIICVSAANMSKTEINIATNELLYERAFYAAESGLQHLTELLRSQYVEGNAAILSSGGTSNWSFALQGAADSDMDGVGDFAGGVNIINTNLDNINLQVRIWNNNDGGGPASDSDGLIYVRSEARGARGALCRIEMLLEGNMDGTAVSDYIAQEGAGPGKNFVSDDAEAMENFSQTNLSVE